MHELFLEADGILWDKPEMKNTGARVLLLQTLPQAAPASFQVHAYALPTLPPLV